MNRLPARRPAIVAALLSCALVTGSARADWPVNGMRVAPTTTAQFDLASAADDSGGVYISWWDYSDNNAYVQHVLADGTIASGWPVRGLRPCNVSGTQQRPALASDGAGGVYVAWHDSRSGLGLCAQHLTSAGGVVAGWPAEGRMIATGASSAQLSLICLPDGAGGVVIARSHSFGGSLDLYVYRIDFDGSTHAGWPEQGFIAASAASDARGVPDGTGGLLAAWGFQDTRLIRVTGEGTVPAPWPVGGQLLLGGTGRFEDIAPDGSGGAYVAMTDRDGVVVQRLTSEGAVASGWDYPVRRVCSCCPSRTPRLMADATDGVYVVWQLNMSIDIDLSLSRFTGRGDLEPGWPLEGRPLGVLAGSQYAAQAASDGHGGVILGWQDQRDDTVSAAFNENIYGHHVNRDGSSSTGWPDDGRPICDAPRGQYQTGVVSDGNGGAFVTWLDDRSGNSQVYVTRVLGNGAVVGARGARPGEPVQRARRGGRGSGIGLGSSERARE